MAARVISAKEYEQLVGELLGGRARDVGQHYKNLTREYERRCRSHGIPSPAIDAVMDRLLFDLAVEITDGEIAGEVGQDLANYVDDKPY